MVDEAETILFLLKSQTQHLSTIAFRQRLLLNLNIPVIKFFNPFLDYNIGSTIIKFIFTWIF